jgi:hypothetical protein
MKYVVEMTEGEYTTIFKTIENVVGKVCETAVKMEELRGQRCVSPSVNISSPPKEPKMKVADVDDHVEAKKVINFTVHERPDGAEVGRGDNRGMEAPPEAPLPAKVVVDNKQLMKGKAAFSKLVDLWRINFNAEGSQPDRAEAMRSLANGPKSFAVLAYVKASGGLSWAINAAVPSGVGSTETERQSLVTQLAGNITQVASILFPDLSDLYEFKDIFARPEEDNDHE